MRKFLFFLSLFFVGCAVSTETEEPGQVEQALSCRTGLQNSEGVYVAWGCVDDRGNSNQNDDLLGFDLQTGVIVEQSDPVGCWRETLDIAPSLSCFLSRGFKGSATPVAERLRTVVVKSALVGIERRAYKTQRYDVLVARGCTSYKTPALCSESD